jgi:flagellar biosynthetic protein FlhB
MAEERTEQATPKRRDDARKRGQVPHSREVTATAGLLGGLAILQASGSAFLTGLGESMRQTLGHLPTEAPSPALVTTAGIALALRLLLLLAPLLGGLLVIAVVANVAQVGLLLTAKPLAPDVNRINPAQGLKRLFGRQGLVELVKALVKLAIVGVVTYRVFLDRFQPVVMLTGADPLAAAAAIAGAVFEVGYKAGFGLLALALLDYGYQRWEYERGLRMSRQELREEYKQTEGDPQLKARIRRTQRQMAMRRMMQAVPTADVVLTNPTHLAVALQYDAARMAAPTVVAKGAELIAERIKTVAAEHGVPVLENKPLARALHAACEIGDQIPADLYQAVAEVLAFIFSLKHGAGVRAQRSGPAGRGAGRPDLPPAHLLPADP